MQGARGEGAGNDMAMKHGRESGQRTANAGPWCTPGQWDVSGGGGARTHVRSLTCNIRRRRRAHGHANVGLLQRGRVIRAVTGNCHDLLQPLVVLHDLKLLLGRRAARKGRSGPQEDAGRRVERSTTTVCSNTTQGLYSDSGRVSPLTAQRRPPPWIAAGPTGPATATRGHTQRSPQPAPARQRAGCPPQPRRPRPPPRGRWGGSRCRLCGRWTPQSAGGRR